MTKRYSEPFEKVVDARDSRQVRDCRNYYCEGIFEETAFDIERRYSEFTGKNAYEKIQNYVLSYLCDGGIDESLMISYFLDRDPDMFNEFIRPEDILVESVIDEIYTQFINRQK
ncbi:MAG: hypothetical protein K2H01_11085 [Ruminococcus sp.]|nr:hypothetical protein [Ruminococcus sp.]